MFFYDEGPKKPGEKKIKKLERKTVEVGEMPGSSPSDSGQALAVQAPNTGVDSGPAAREQLFAAYVTSYFPIDVTGATQLDPWFDLVEGTATLPSRPMMLEKAVAAKSCLFLGKINNDERMFCHGLQLFNNAIQHMSRQLSKKKNVYSDELVFTVVYFQKLVVSLLSLKFEIIWPLTWKLKSCYCPHGLDVWMSQMEVTNGILKQCARRASNNPMIQSIYLAFQRVRLVCPNPRSSGYYVNEDPFDNIGRLATSPVTHAIEKSNKTNGGRICISTGTESRRPQRPLTQPHVDHIQLHRRD